MRLIGKNEDGARYHLWPIRLGWHDNLIPRLRFFAWHGWQTGYDTVPPEKTSRGCMPGYRSTFGQTLHFGRLFICFGPKNWQGVRRASGSVPREGVQGKVPNPASPPQGERR